MFTRPVGTPIQQNLGVPLLKENSLSDVESAASARSNLGLGATDSPTFVMVAEGVVSTPTAAGTTTLTAASKLVQIFTGVTTQNVDLPAANSLGAGIALHFVFFNASSGTVTLRRIGADTIWSGFGTGVSFAVTTQVSVEVYSDGVSKWYVR